MIKHSCVRQCLYSISFNLTKANKLFRFQFDRKCRMQRYCRRRRQSNRKIAKWDCAPACLFVGSWKRLCGSIGTVLISFSICQMRLPSRSCRKAVIYHLHLLRPPSRGKGSLGSSLNSACLLTYVVTQIGIVSFTYISGFKCQVVPPTCAHPPNWGSSSGGRRYKFAFFNYRPTV